jgi:hypothetical protein
MADLECFLHSLWLLLMTLRPKAAISDDLALLSSPFLSGSNRRTTASLRHRRRLHCGLPPVAAIPAAAAADYEQPKRSGGRIAYRLAMRI